MKAILTIALSALMLAGCADGYDKSAVPNATAAMHQASDRCEVRRATNGLKTSSEFEACELAAERNFATAINLKKISSFEEYASRMQGLAADLDANRITREQARFDADAIRRDFWADCACVPRTDPRWSNYTVGTNGNPNVQTAVPLAPAPPLKF